MWPLRRQQIITINDNRGKLFTFDRQGDQSFVAREPRSQEHGTLTGAIGELRVTDCLLLLGTDLALPSGVILTDPEACPSGLPALRSFAEALRRGAATAMDLEPQELSAGIQTRLHGSRRTGVVYIADTLQNGAGYADELGRNKLGDVLRQIVGPLTDGWLDQIHVNCDSSCPDCLRSWDNQHLHGSLDWRLAIEVASLSLGWVLPDHGWNSRIHQNSEQFASSFGEVLGGLELTELHGVPALVGKDALALVVHPLWSRDEATMSAQQKQALELAKGRRATVFWTDPRELRARPDTVWAALATH